ncbi:MAG: hypothetical protein ACNA8W_21205 [Bradymonadaceae bacterium]
MSDKQGRTSKLFILAGGGVTVIAVIAWTAVYYFEAPGYNPEIAQEYVQHFNRRCMRDLQDEQKCRDVIGHHHRSCFEEHLSREIPGDESSAYVYDRGRYMDCLWAAAK